jgi:signal peptidase I
MRRRNIIAAAAAAAIIGAAAGAMVRRFAVSDSSMEPALRHGDWLMARRLLRPPHPGDIVIFRNDRMPDRWLIKRVSENRPDGTAIVLGDNLQMSSADSRMLGPIPHRSIRWKVVWRYWPADRIGSVSA